MPLPLRVAAAAAAAAAAVAFGLAAPRAAHAEQPDSRLGLVFGGRLSMGDLGPLYRAGIVYGVHAGFTPWAPSKRVHVGFAWGVARDQLFSSSDENVDSSLYLLHVSMATRTTARLPTRLPMAVTLELGLDLVRADTPVPPSGDDSSVGATAALGVELFASGAFAALTLSWSQVAPGSSSAALLLSVGVGR